MRRSVAVVWHASFFVLAGALYFFFVLPRWYELLNRWTPALGNPVRIVDGVLIGLCALPVVFTLLRTRNPEIGTPRLALSLLSGSVTLHVVAGLLIVGSAVSEYWLGPDRAGQWLFGGYGAAAALAVLGAMAFYLALLAELPPPPPKERKVKSTRRVRGKADVSDDPDEPDEPEVEADVAAEAEADPEADVTATPPTVDTPSDTEAKPGDAEGKLRNRRPADKQGARRFGRRRGGVALDD